MAALLELKGLAKTFGRTRALDGVDMSLREGQIAGLLGPNASGKTTLLKAAAGLWQPTAGEIFWPRGAGAGPQARASVAFCPDGMAFPRDMRVNGAFGFYRDMYPDYSPERAGRLMSMLDLADKGRARVEKLSKGMKERLMLALTLSRETDLYLLDEPLDGIDPVGKSKIIEAILSLKPEHASVLISTHMVKDLESVFDSVFFLSKGKIVFSGECDAMREEKNRSVEQAYLEVFLHEGSA